MTHHRQNAVLKRDLVRLEPKIRMRLVDYNAVLTQLDDVGHLEHDMATVLREGCVDAGERLVFPALREHDSKPISLAFDVGKKRGNGRTGTTAARKAAGGQYPSFEVMATMR